jgi:hypothetical protein
MSSCNVEEVMRGWLITLSMLLIVVLLSMRLLP